MTIVPNWEMWALWGPLDAAGLADPTKWMIMSQRRNLESKMIPNPIVHFAGSVNRHGKGKRVELTLGTMQRLGAGIMLSFVSPTQ